MSTMRLVQTGIKIPKRIKRGPTDILKALSATVKYLPKEPEPSIIDDPFLLPTRPGSRRIYMLSRLSGVKTAQFLLNKHPELFYRDDAEPKVEAFIPKEQFSPDMDFTVDDLVWCIDNKDAQNGVIAYNSLTEKNINIDNELLLKFFEMVCYTNEENVLDFAERESLRFLPDSEGNLVKHTWKTTGLASKIFNQIKVDLDPSRVYSAMIAGLARFNEYRQASQVFEDFKTNHQDEGLFVEAYDALLRSVPKLHSSHESAMQAVSEIVKHMEQSKVKPNLMIFNSILYTNKYFNCSESTCQDAFKLVNDMHDLGIQPSLATHASLVAIVCRYKKGSVYGNLVKDILTNLQSSKLDVRDERDTDFFPNTMYFISTHLNNVPLANTLYKLYLNQPDFFANNQTRNKFLINYFKLLVTADSLENSLNFYESNVPHNFVPDADSYEAFGEALDVYGASEDVIRKIGQDIIDAKLALRVKNDAIFRRIPEYVNALDNIAQ